MKCFGHHQRLLNLDQLAPKFVNNRSWIINVLTKPNVTINLPCSFSKFKTKLTRFSFRKPLPVFTVWVICKYKISQNVPTSYVKKLLRYICKFLITKFTSVWHSRLRWNGFDWSQNSFQCGGSISQAGGIRVRGFKPALSSPFRVNHLVF